MVGRLYTYAKQETCLKNPKCHLYIEGRVYKALVATLLITGLYFAR